MAKTFDPSTRKQDQIEAALALFGGDRVQVADHLGADIRAVEAVWQRMRKINAQRDGASTLETALRRRRGDLAKAAADVGLSLRAARRILRQVQPPKPATKPAPKKQRRLQVEPTEDCGTINSYRRHIRRGEAADDLCCAANTKYGTERRAARRAAAAQ